MHSLPVDSIEASNTSLAVRIFTLSILTLAFIVRGYSENPRFQEVGTPIPALANLNLVWDVGTNRWASSAWVYQIVPNKFSPKIISNLETICSFTANDKKVDGVNGMFYQNTNNTRKLSIDYNTGKIQYDTKKRHYDEKHLSVGVLAESLIPKLTTDILEKIGINLGEIDGYFGTNKIGVSKLGATYFFGTNSVENTESRFGYFRRILNGWAFVGSDGGRVYFGENGQIAGMEIQWNNLVPFKSYPTLKQDDVMASIRNGRARMGLIPQNVNNFDWEHVKSIKIEKVWPSYYAGTSPMTSKWVYPFMTLWTSVDTGVDVFGLEIDCPIITED